MRRWLIYCVCGVVISALLPACNSSYEIIRPTLLLTEQLPPFDKEQFIAYVDTAAVDDWEGVWLLAGNNLQDCYVAIENVNQISFNARYSHYVRAWNSIVYSGELFCQSGQVLAYLKQGFRDDTKLLVLSVNTIMGIKKIELTVKLDKTRRYIYIEKGNGHSVDIGFRRIYPIRSPQEEEYKVRYL